MRIVLVFFWLLSAQAFGSGFYFGDNGAKAMVQGGAFTGQADDLTAMQHNPAGLTQLQGFSFLADLQVIRHDVSFWRQDPGYDPKNPANLAQVVKSDPSAFFLPLFALSYGFELAGRPFTVGLGLIAPPAQGRYAYSEPNYKKDANNRYLEPAQRFSPQRYALVMTDIVIAYPTLSLAYRPHSMFEIGVSAQLAISRFQQKQTLFGGDALGLNPTRQANENPDYDASVGIDLAGQIGFTGILGLMFRPNDWLSFGASVRPPIPFKGRGKLTVEMSEAFKPLASVQGDTATLTMTMPLEVRLGAMAKPFPGLGVNFDFVYQGWNSIDQLLLTPENVSLVVNNVPNELKPFQLTKNWKATWSLRLGASYRIFEYLSASLGAMYETGAAPTTTFSVDWTHPTRVMVTGGLTGHLGPIDVIAGAMFTPVQTINITDSEVVRQQSNPESPTSTVGNGIYTSGGYSLIFGVRGNFGGPKVQRPVGE